MELRFIYIVSNLIFFLPFWLVFFIRRPNVRKKMLLLSFLGGIAGPLSEYWYHQDYWRPQTVLDTPVGIEDFLFGFLFAGVACGSYQFFFQKNYRSSKTNMHTLLRLFSILFIALGLVAVLFFLGFNSIYASIITCIVLLTFILYQRKDLFLSSLFSGFFCTGIFVVMYQILFLFFPNLFEKWWMLDNLSGVQLLSIPLEELAWAFFAGGAIGIVYEFAAKLRYDK
ncbi:MAG TPA: lycopene cyclase domain-containing protein [Patescibacteria group bacterium]|nr:lycopene cyclase domain-containing protein [Patescibacteria group bacterium]